MKKMHSFPFVLLGTFFFLTACTLLTAAYPDVLQAADQASLIKEANGLFRSAERNFHNGKHDQARADLEKAKQTLNAAQAEGENSQVKSLASKLEKLDRDLDRRQGKTGTHKASSPPAQASSPQKVKMPSKASRDLRELNRQLKKTLASLEYEKWWDLSPSIRETRLSDAEKWVVTGREHLEDILSDLDPALGQAPEIVNAREFLNNIEVMIPQRSSGSEPKPDVDPQVEEALAIGGQIEELYEKYGSRLQNVHGRNMVRGSLLEEQFSVGRAAVQELDSLENEVVPEIQPVLLLAAEKYGTDSMEVDNALFDLGIKGNDQFGTSFDILYKGLNNISASRRASSEFLAQSASEIMTGISSFSEEIRLQRLSEAKKMLVLGKKFDPADPRINAELAEVDRLYAETSAGIEKDIDDRVWAGDVDDFDGPGRTDDLAEEALRFFRDHPAWNPSGKGVRILNVAVRGPWDVATTDIFGRVIQWRLPVHLVLTNAEMEKDNRARVYELSVLTRKGNPGATDKEPPFSDYWVGDSWNMRLNKVQAR